MKLIRSIVLFGALMLLVTACAGATTAATPSPPTVPETTTTTAAPTTAAPTTSTTEPATTTTTVLPEAFPVTISAANGEVTVESIPKHIVSLSPTGTEMLFAIGAGDQVTAVDSYSYYPAEAPVTDLSAFQPDVEAVVSYGPDLVIVSHDPDGFVAGMEAVGVTVLLLPAAETLDDTYTQIEQLGAATGHVGEAALLVADMRTDIDEIVSGLPEFDEPPTYFHELSSSLYSASSGTFIGQVYALLGLENIADAAEGGGLYPQLSVEYIIEQDPDFIFLADASCCGESAETVAARPGWGEMSAVTGGRVVELDTDVASRWGPRIVDFLETVAGAVSKASVPTG